MIWVGVDIGGTFTDAVTYDDANKSLRYAKTPSVPADPTRAVLDVLARLDLDLSGVQRFIHGITIGTNAILEGKGAEVWMLTTEGFRDVLEIARTNRPVLYNIKSLKPPPIVPRTRVMEIPERMLYDGGVRKPLDEDAVRRAVKQIPGGGNRAVAICFLHSYANPSHENAAAEIVRGALSETFVCTSSEVLSQFREYERFNTTALNALIGPLIGDYLTELERALAAGGYGSDVFIMTSNGGASTASRAKRLPVSTVLSGPAGGVAAAVHLGAQMGIENLITCDMGGTSTDVCLIEALNFPMTNEQFIGDYANRMPQIEINAVGAGGGSIAWIDAGDILMVGPRSAGADPGPACYAAGGTEPTVTDANLILHRLGPGGKLGGRIQLDEQAALSAMERLAAHYPAMDVQALAEGIIHIAVARMVSAIKQISVAKGYDPRDFVLVAYGGAGPMHAALIGEALEIPRVVIPRGPGNFAAFGSLISDIRQDYVRTLTLQPNQVQFSEIMNEFAEIEATGRANLIAEGVASKDIGISRTLGMRYLGQSWELDVEVPDSVQSIQALNAAFYDVHERRFGHKSAADTEIVNFRVTATGRVEKPALPLWEGQGPAADAILETRNVIFDGASIEVSVFDRERLGRNVRFTGPAIVEESGATTVVPPGWQVTVLDRGHLLLERDEQ